MIGATVAAECRQWDESQVATPRKAEDPPLIACPPHLNAFRGDLVSLVLGSGIVLTFHWRLEIGADRVFSVR